MNPTRRKFLLSASAAFLTAHPAIAQDDVATQSVIRQLQAQGFEVLSARRTLLGRIRILARRGDLRREVVLDPRNGVILRDYTAGSGGEPSIGGSQGPGTGGQNGQAPGGDPDDGDDDDEDDDDDGDDDDGDDDQDDDDDDDDDDDGGSGGDDGGGDDGGGDDGDGDDGDDDGDDDDD